MKYIFSLLFLAIPVFAGHNPGAVTSDPAAKERIERAYAVTSGSPSCTINAQSGSWATSCTRTGTGQANLTIASGVFSATPHCVISVYNAGNQFAQMNCTSATACSWSARNSLGTLTDGIDVYFLCMGSR